MTASIFRLSVPRNLALHQHRFDNTTGVAPYFFMNFSFPKQLLNAVEYRKMEFFAGRFCAFQALMALRGIPFAPIGMSEDRSPIWPSGIVGAITHSEGIALAVVGEDKNYRGIGIDIERKLSHAHACQLSRQVLSPGETWQKWGSTHEFSLLITLIFSLKESLFKALHPEVKRFFGFNSAKVIDIDWSGKRFSVMLTETLSPLYRQGGEFSGQFDIQKDYVATLLTVDRRESLRVV